MPLTNRIQTLQYIVQDLELGAALASSGPDDDMRRTLARHVLIRAQDFVIHCDGILGLLAGAGCPQDSVQDELDTYRTFFDEYFVTARHKLAGHVQDLDFLHRIELWNSIEAGKLGFFVDSAIDIYRHLANCAVPEYPSYSPFPELADGEFLRSLRAFADDNAPDGRVRMASDALAATRPGATFALNFHPVSVRASQLALAGRWVARQERMRQSLTEYRNAERILRTRLVTDVVSFADCLVTRTSGSGRHCTIGFNDLLMGPDTDQRFEGAHEILEQFLRRFKYRTRLGPLRTARNKLGGHLHYSTHTAQPLTTLLVEFDAVAVDDVLEFFGMLWRVFLRVCRADPFLQVYAVQDVPLDGVIGPVEGNSVVSFDPEKPDAIPRPQLPRSCDNVDALRSCLETWVAGEEDAEEAGRRFCSAFASSDVVEAVARPCKPGDVTHTFELRHAHLLLVQHLAASNDAATWTSILKLIEMGSRGFPEPLAEVLLRCWPMDGRPVSDAMLLCVLGEVATWDRIDARTIAIGLARSDDDDTALEAAICAFKLYQWSEFHPRRNENRTVLTFATTVLPLLQGWPVARRMVAMAAFASCYSWHPMFGDSSGLFMDDYALIVSELRACAAALNLTSQQLDHVLEYRDFVAGCLLAYHALAGPDPSSARLFLGAPGARVHVGRHYASQLNFARVLAARDQQREGIGLVRAVVERFPVEVDVLLDCAETLSAIRAFAEARDILRCLGVDYLLDERQSIRVAQMGKQMAGEPT